MRTSRHVALDAVTLAAKAATVACAVDALVNYREPRLQGKAIRVRAIGYTAALAIVPLAWLLLPGPRGRYPRLLDLAVTGPLLADAAGNAFGVYERAHVDDAVHVANAAIATGVSGSLIASYVDEPWQAALAGAGVAVVGETLWETMEYSAMRLGQGGMDLTYDDTMGDIIDTWIGAVIGALFLLLRTPRHRSRRTRRGWRGWRAMLGA